MIKMSGVMRSSLKFYPSSGFMNLFRRTIKPENTQQRLYSTLWNTCPKSTANIAHRSTAVWNKCNTSPKLYSTKSENELAEFLEQEISAEQKLQKNKTIPSKIDDFDVKLNGSEVTLVKSIPGETITIRFNINDSVDAYDPNEGIDGDEADENRVASISSKPEFSIAIKRGDTTLEFICNYSADEVGPDDDEEMGGDVFVIEEVSSYKGEAKETNYRVSGGILDGYLYDLLMNYLDEKGITNEFVMNVSQLSTAYEHSSYISLLRDLKSFTSK
ncbi:complement component 1 Q subcomponent-binding protein, mitochondrial-like [Planococcus citri]|uniref:complement component 1 Q subcomponent-binding protein, mitochondrial-like n=1 Tax=Planococcus citri TaxID=170843 RepID=UPI0031F9D907